MTSQQATTTQSDTIAVGLYYQRKHKRRRKKTKKLKQCVPHSMDKQTDSESSDDNIYHWNSYNENMTKKEQLKR